MQQLAATGEKAEADLGYRGQPDRIWLPQDDNAALHEKNDVRARQESVNRLLKNFSILHRVFRHERVLHDPVFRAVATITELRMANQNPIFGVPYNEV